MYVTASSSTASNISEVPLSPLSSAALDDARAHGRGMNDARRVDALSLRLEILLASEVAPTAPTAAVRISCSRSADEGEGAGEGAGVRVLVRVLVVQVRLSLSLRLRLRLRRRRRRRQA